MKGSLRNRLVLLAIGVLVLYYGLVLLLSLVFMEPYYLHKVEGSLVTAYKTIEKDTDGGEAQDRDTLSDVISGLNAPNLSVLVADLAEDTILYNSNPQLRDSNVSGKIAMMLENNYTRASASSSGYVIDPQVTERKDSGQQPSPDALGSQDAPPKLDDLVVDADSGVKFVILSGILGESIVQISTPYSSISQATTISLQFSLLVGLVVMALAALAFSKMSSVIIRPVTQITQVADKIAHLDFSEKCEVQGKSELGHMAESVNTMSDCMQTYIAQLQTANDQLKADLQQRQELTDARKNLVSNLSHDLKTPIGLISGYADGLRQGMAKTDEEVKEYCDIICDESDRMMAMILRMMELFRLESGTIEPECEDFDLSELVRNQLGVFGMELEKADIRLTATYEDDCYIFSDYFSVEQIVTNYIQNAIAHMRGGKWLRVSVGSGSPGMVRVSVSNAADPIPEEELSRLWESFYRLDKSRGRSQRQSGLGLAIVQGNISLLGGACGVSNIPGGVCFWAELKRSAPELQNSAADPSDPAR